jgi:hypothetical protein
VEQKFRTIVEQERLRSQTTQRLLFERAQTVDHYEMGETALGWEVFSAWLRCEKLIEQCLMSNLTMYDMRMEYLEVEGEGRGWDVSDFGRNYSIIRQALAAKEHE